VITISSQIIGAIQSWLGQGRGVAVWQSINLSNPGGEWFTPARTVEGAAVTKPNWQCGNEPTQIIESTDEVQVVTPKEVKRLKRIGIRHGSQGLSLKLTDASSARVRNAVSEAEDEYGEAWYEFAGDIFTGVEVVICVPGNKMPLAEYLVEMQKQDWNQK
jgi:hypothetical protein